MRTSWQQLHRSLVSLAAAAILGGAATPARAARPIEDSEPFGSPRDAETLDLENFGLLPRWTAPLHILNRGDEQLRSLAVFKLSQVVAPQADDNAEAPVEEKPAFRIRLPKVRDEAVEPERSGEKKESQESGVRSQESEVRTAETPGFRRGKLDIREHDLAERPNLLQPTVGSWLGDVSLMPIQVPEQPQVIPPPVPPTPELPVPPATPNPDLPPPPPSSPEPGTPQLFPPGELPGEPAPIPWGTSRGSRLEAPEPEPEPEPPKEPEELKLRRPTSTWDLAELEGPLFGTDEIAEFSRKISAAGTWAVRPHFSMSTLYDGNVFLSEAGQTSDLIVTASPGVTARIGNDETPLYLTADYTFGAVFFAENDDENSFNHNARLNLDWRGARTTAGLRMGVENDSGTSIDATDRVRRTGFSVGGEASFRYSDKLSFDANADYHRSYYENLIGSEDYGMQGYVNYHYSPKLSLGVGGGLTMTQVEDGRSQQSENISMKANWVASGKLTIEGSLGVGFYQYDSGEPDAMSPVASLRATWVATGKLTFSGDIGVGMNRFESGGDPLSPTFSLDATWAVWSGTVVTFNAHRRTFSSVIFGDQNYNSTGIVFGLRQQLGIRFTAFITAGYETLEYTSAAPGVEATREDDYLFARFGLQWHAFTRCSFGVFYEFSQNSSGGEGARDFRRDRVGGQMSVVF